MSKRRRDHARRPRPTRTHLHRRRADGWAWIPVYVDSRVDAGQPIGCVGRFPDNFVDALAEQARVPVPEHVFFVNANRSPRNEVDETDRAFICLDCCIDRWPDSADAFRIAVDDLLAVADGAGGWIERTWQDFGLPAD